MKNIFLSSKQLFEEIGKVVKLYKNLWSERTICLLHARRETPKTDRALDITLEVAAAGRKTLAGQTTVFHAEVIAHTAHIAKI